MCTKQAVKGLGYELSVENHCGKYQCVELV
jgi:hypothetical protein